MFSSNIFHETMMPCFSRSGVCPPQSAHNFHHFASSGMSVCKTIAKSGSYSCRDLALHGMNLCWPQSCLNA